MTIVESPLPLLLEPTPSRRIWGGDRLAPLAGLDPGDDPTPIGEVWSAYGGNIIAAGAHRGRPLEAVIAEQGERLLGRATVARYGLRMPLLAKLIDAAAPLSIQVHPDDAYATTAEAASGHLGKAEAWCVLEAEPGATIVWGWRRDVAADEVAAAVADGSVEALLRTVPVRAGDLVYNPPGLVHAIGAGILLYEIQQDSDLTYRLYDYRRRGADGRLRELHLDRALAVANLEAKLGDPLPSGVATAGWTRLLRTPFFILERAELRGRIDFEAVEHSLSLVTMTAGSAELSWDGGGLPLSAGRSALVPAGTRSLRLDGNGTLFLATVPAEGRRAV
jgi:mannose-6-phosphate isomerase